MTRSRDTVHEALQALEAVVADRRLSTRSRALWRKVLIEVRRLAGVRLVRGRPVWVDYRQVYALAQAGHGTREIAERLGCSSETVRRALRRVQACPTPPARSDRP
jgi:DNA-directed RNA polymerase specialized sigma24 family protein